MKTILIIEDNAEVRETTAEIIELANYKVITAGDGKAGVEQALKKMPDLIVCDIMMPVLDGYGVYHLLSKHKETSLIPFIFLTAKSEKGDFRKGMQMGADDYITKPFDGTELLTAIETRLKKTGLLKEQYSGTHALDNFLDDVKLTGKVTLNSEAREVFSYNKKATVFKEGQRPRVLYYVVSGKIKIFKTSDDGKELITSIHGSQEFFGHIPILADVNYMDGAEALEESDLMLIPREDFLQLISNDMLIAQKFIKIITQNISEKENDLLHLAYSSLRKKVAHGIIQLLEKYKNEEGSKQIINLSRENMAQSIGVATESVIRTLGDFKEEKLIDIEGGKIKIIDAQKLKDLRN